ncbi:MAG: hypothetical protein ABEH66_06870, partial [Halobacteriales archaeon]
SSFDSVASDICSDLLTIERPSEEDVLAVTLTDSPDDWMDEWERSVGPERPAKLSFVSADDGMRSAAAGGGGGALSGNMSVDTVSNPSDLTGLGMHISERLSGWQGDGNQIVVDFDSLTTLLEYAPRESVFKFIHVLKGRVDSADAVAHYHMDPSAHAPQEVSTFKTLVDAVVEVEDGEWTIASR